MTLSIKVDLSGLKQLEGELRSRLTNVTVDMAAAIEMYEAKVFATEGSINGQQWQPITSSTKRKRKAMGVDPDAPILHARGLLSTSYNVGYSVDWPEFKCTLEFEDLYTIWDEKLLPLPDVHHFGLDRYPKRPLFNEEVVEEICLEIAKRV